MGIAIVSSDGSSPDARVQLVAQHRPAFTAGGLDLQYARQWVDTMPALYDDPADDEPDEPHAPTPRDRAAQVRRLGVIALVGLVLATFIALSVFMVWTCGLTQAGLLVGLADFRPTFGRFGITSFEVLA